MVTPARATRSDDVKLKFARDGGVILQPSTATIRMRQIGPHEALRNRIFVPCVRHVMTNGARQAEKVAPIVTASPTVLVVAIRPRTNRSRITRPASGRDIPGPSPWVKIARCSSAGSLSQDSPLSLCQCVVHFLPLALTLPNLTLYPFRPLSRFH